MRFISHVVDQIGMFFFRNVNTPMRYSIILTVVTTDNFQRKKCDTFLSIAQNRNCVYSLCVRGGSNVLHNLCYRVKTKKYYTPF